MSSSFVCAGGRALPLAPVHMLLRRRRSPEQDLERKSPSGIVPLQFDQCNPRIVPATQIFLGSTQDTFDLLLRNAMFIDVGKSRLWIKVVPNLHPAILARNANLTEFAYA
jgi:hypothetical protein